MSTSTDHTQLTENECNSGGLYVHVPFCETKCGYCDFYSVPVEGEDTDSLLTAILSELVSRTGNCPPIIRTVFIGGGTPTILSVDQLQTLSKAVVEAVGRDTIDEFTVEANPATIDRVTAAALVHAGVTRVSLGAQSFHPQELAFLERLHAPGDIAPAIALIREAGILDYNIDLMFGIGGQTLSSWRESLMRALDLNPTHIACYGLTYEPGTRLTGQLNCGEIQRCDEDAEADMYLMAIDLLADAGFEHYEISNFAQPGRACRHNLNYWNNGAYVGVGPSAAGCVNGRRYKNVPNAKRYAEWVSAGRLPEIDSEVIEGEALAIETLMMQLRQVRGISMHAFFRRTGVDLGVRAKVEIDQLRSAGLVELADGFLCLTRRGLLVANAVMVQLSAALESRSSVTLPLISPGRG